MEVRTLICVLFLLTQQYEGANCLDSYETSTQVSTSTESSNDATSDPTTSTESTSESTAGGTEVTTSSTDTSASVNITEANVTATTTETTTTTIATTTVTTTTDSSPETTTTEPADDTDDDFSDKWRWVLIATGVVLVLVAAVIALICLKRRGKLCWKKASKNLTLNLENNSSTTRVESADKIYNPCLQVGFTNTAVTTATDGVTMETQVDEHDVMNNSDDVNPENADRSMKGDRMLTFI